MGVWRTSEPTISAASLVAGSWKAPGNISGGVWGATVPQIAVSPGGDAIAIWRKSGDGTHEVIEAASRPPGDAWQSPVVISTPQQEVPPGDTTAVSHPQVAIDSSGNAVAVWEGYNGSAYFIQSASKPADSSWQTPVDLFSDPDQMAADPQIATDPTGDAIAVWRRRYNSVTSEYVIEAASRSAGDAWQSPVVVSDPLESSYAPQVAVDPSGSAVIVWSTYSYYGAIQAADKTVEGAWSEPVDLSAAGQFASEPQIAIDANGNAAAVWTGWPDSV
ncbi:MAG: hypothetical protein WBZ24_04410, partial [Anaerolineales bacterium]